MVNPGCNQETESVGKVVLGKYSLSTHAGRTHGSTPLRNQLGFGAAEMGAKVAMVALN